MPGWWAQCRACVTMGQLDDTFTWAEQGPWPPAPPGGRVCAGNALLGGTPAGEVQMAVLSAGSPPPFCARGQWEGVDWVEWLWLLPIHPDPWCMFILMLLYKSKWWKHDISRAGNISSNFVWFWRSASLLQYSWS